MKAGEDFGKSIRKTLGKEADLETILGPGGVEFSRQGK